MSLQVGNTRPLDATPIPLSFPAILRNPGIAARYAYLADDAPEKAKLSAPKKHKAWRSDNEGKRWVRRKENSRFSGNVHIVQPGKMDLLPPQGPQIRSTFPEPLPHYLSRDTKLPNAMPAARDRSADSGRYSLSLKGMRRDLRTMSFRSQPLVHAIETELLEWLDAGGTVLFPEERQASLDSGGRPIGETGIIELSRTPLQLVWKVGADDAFARYVVHCTARYHKIVSYSKETSGQRLTYLLRPNVAYPEFQAANGVDTPPATDVDLSSQLDSDSEFASDRDARSEAGDSVAGVEHMSTINEDAVASPRLSPTPLEGDWAIVGDADADGDESGNELVESIDSLAVDPDETLVVERRFAHLSLRSRASAVHSQIRSSSSPSRSPVRPPRRAVRASAIRPSPKNLHQSFYDYLFS